MPVSVENENILLYEELENFGMKLLSCRVDGSDFPDYWDYYPRLAPLVVVGPAVETVGLNRYSSFSADRKSIELFPEGACVVFLDLVADELELAEVPVPRLPPLLVLITPGCVYGLVEPPP